MASHGVRRPTEFKPRTKQENLDEQIKIQEYKDLENLIHKKVTKQEYTHELLDLTSKLLKINPEYYTIWNVRRRLLVKGLFQSPSNSLLPVKLFTDPSTNTITAKYSHSTPAPPEIVPSNHITDSKNDSQILRLIKADLEFLFPIMVKFPKCYWLWNYRLWLLQQANERLDDVNISRELWTRELQLVGKMLIKDNRNFHGWDYRRMVVAQLESSRLNGKSMVESEFEYTTKIIHAPNGLSNFSAWHWRSKLLPRLLTERNSDVSARLNFLDNEFEMIVSAIYTDSYPYQQSAWFYYQFLMTTIIEPGKYQVTVDLTHKDRCNYVHRQLNVLKEMLDGAEDCKWIYNAVIDYTLAICQMEERKLQHEERSNCVVWLKELKKIDPFRTGRWEDFEKVLKLLT